MSDNALELATTGQANVDDSQRQILQIDIFEHSIILTEFDERQTPVSCREVSPTDVAAALSGLAFNTGLLPPNCLFYGREGSDEKIIIYLPPQRRVLQVKDRMYDIPLPALVFVGHQVEYQVFAVKQRPTAGNPRERLFHAPFPNVHKNGRICPGTVAFPSCSSAHEAADLFLDSGFNTHITAGKSERHPEDVLALWEEIEGDDEFPAEDLIKSQFVFSDLID
jgi:PRTRC genetic system protein B